MKIVHSKSFLNTRTQSNDFAIKQAGVEDNPRFKGPYNPNRDNPMWPMSDLPRMRMRQAVLKELEYSLDREMMREASSSIDNCLEKIEEALSLASETLGHIKDCAKKLDIEEKDVWEVVKSSRSLQSFAETINNLET